MSRTVYFAGGCFWGVEHFFKGVDGVLGTEPGYANGNIANPTYEQVYTDTTGFAETVRVLYDPSRVGLSLLVRLFFTIIDPMSLNRQGHDEGTRYRTGVYYDSPEDLPVIEAEFSALRERLGAGPVVELQPLRCFYGAEERHRDYLDKNAGGYCHLPLKVFRYLRLYQDIRLMLAGEPDPVARMAEAAALIFERMRFFWVGFYRVDGDELVLGPFQGPAACLRIARSRGVCGAA
ncbi:MAG: peptide-methionine (S)-S-oxide reductase MsrA, partial [Bacteroidales bacterium]|nr:peptide-methionine (S)-S-oxide reductase MsrA [Bacteroidales bacterium]